MSPIGLTCPAGGISRLSRSRNSSQRISGPSSVLSGSFQPEKNPSPSRRSAESGGAAWRRSPPVRPGAGWPRNPQEQIPSPAPSPHLQQFLSASIGISERHRRAAAEGAESYRRTADLPLICWRYLHDRFGCPAIPSSSSALVVPEIPRGYGTSCRRRFGSISSGLRCS